MSDDTDLTDFGVRQKDDIPPFVYRRAVIESPTAEGKPAGFVGYDRRREYVVYTSRRKPYHFYHEGAGFAISTSIYHHLSQTGVSRVLLHQPDPNGDVWEHSLRKYRTDGEPIPRENLLDEHDPQVYVPVDEARHKWESHSDGMFVEDFGEAMDRLSAQNRWV